MQCSDIAFAHVQGNVMGAIGFGHGALRLAHQFFGEAKTTVCTHYGKRGYVAMGDAVTGLFFHFGEDIAYDFGGVIWRFLRARDLRHMVSTAPSKMYGLKHKECPLLERYRSYEVAVKKCY
jgi:hypothetical protein